MSQLLSTQAQLQEALARIAPAKQAAPAEDAKLEDLMYSDPAKYTALIEERATQKALEKIQAQGAIQQAVAGLYNEYPELADNDNALTKATREVLKTVPDSEQMNPKMYEYAVMKAAGELGVQPRSKRKAPEPEDDGFVAPSYQSPQARAKKRSTEQVVSQNKDIAKAFGVDLNDPKQKEKYLNILKNKGIV
jgi:hypothetical protein